MRSVPAMTRLARLFAMIGCLAALSSCAGGGGAPAADDEPPAAGPEMPPAVVGDIPAGLTDPCTLLTTAEVSQAAGRPAADGARQPTVDDTYVSCSWFAADDTLKIAPIVGLELFVLNDEMKANVDSDLLSGKGEELPGVGNRTEVQAADLNTTGNSYAAGWKGTVFYRLQCTTPLNGTVASKRICTQAVTTLAGRLT
jgi:hypothetical protein